MQDYLAELKSNISMAVSKSIADTSEVGILFSAGLDSSLMAFLAKKHGKDTKITLYTVGTTDSHDLSNIKQASKLLGMDSKKIEIHAEDIIQAIPKVAGIIDSHHPVEISYELPLYLGLANIDEKLVLSGQGADELFGGYARYLKMEREELNKAIEKNVRELMKSGINMDLRIAKHFQKVLKTPYLEEKVVKTAMQVPSQYKVKEGKRKIILREAAMQLGLPPELVGKEKKAAQYSSGILKELRRMAKKKGIKVNEFIQHLL